MVIQQYYNGTTVVLQWYYSGTTVGSVPSPSIVDPSPKKSPLNGSEWFLSSIKIKK